MTAKKHRPVQGMFDGDLLLERIASSDHVLWRISELVEWERFRHVLDGVFTVVPKRPGGRPSYDRMMFKIMVLKHLYNIPYGKMEQRLIGDLYFRVFLGLLLADPTPDEKTIWLDQDRLCQKGVILELFNAFDAQWHAHGMVASEGRIDDATIVPVPHLFKEDRETLDHGQTPQTWQQNPSIARQRDTEAAWTKKHKKSYFGSKNHVTMDGQTKMIRTFEVTPANIHDSQTMNIFLNTEDDAGQELYADAAYIGAPTRALMRQNKMKDRRHRKAAKNNPLSTYQRRQNKQKSKVRARVEHVFGVMKMKLGDIWIRSIGVIRSTFVIGMRNILYNMCRMDIIKRMRPTTA